MTQRMQNPALVLTNGMQSVLGLSKPVAQAGLDEKLLKLIDLRVSQINGCALCIDMHSMELRKLGETDERLFGVAAWRNAPWFSAAERAALALAEAVTRIADRPEGVTDEVWNEAAQHYDETKLAALLFAIANINVWNRLNVATRQPADGWRAMLNPKAA